MQGELSVGIAGLGKMGIAHMAILNALEGARVAAVAETRGIVRRGVGTVIQSVARYERFEEMLAREDLDAVFVASPTSLHVEMVEACLRRGLHLFVEKPLGVTGREAEHLVPLARDSGAVSMVGYCKHFIETFAKAREVLESGVLGEPIYFNSHMYVSQLFRSGAGWRYKKASSGGGVLNILATHLVDILLWFFGEVDSVSASMKSYYSGEVEDFAHAYLSFRGGPEGSLDASWSVRDYRLPEIKVEVQCAGGSLQVTDDFLKYRTDADGGFHQFYKQDLYRGVEVHVGGPEYAREDRHFLECARSGSPTGIDLAYGYAVQRVTDAMYESAREGRTVTPGGVGVTNVDVLDPIILGHNQFIGVSHLSQDAARSRVERFSDVKKIGEVISYCASVGVTGMMLSTHERSRDILAYMKAEGLSGVMNMYPLIPYAQGYVRLMNAVGLTGMFKEIFESAPLSKKAGISYHGAMGYLKRDLTRMLGAFIDIELLAFKEFNVKAVFLHDAFVDLSLALGAREQIEFFMDHLGKRHGTRPAFVTMNFPMLTDRFDRWGIERPLVMTTFNSAGFQMNPSKAECEESLRAGGAEVVAMSTLAAGHLRPREAYEYVFSLPGVASVAVGVSTEAHARETFGIIRECVEKRAATLHPGGP